MMATRIGTVLLFFLALPLENGPVTTTVTVTKRELMENHFRERKLLVVYGVENDAETAALLEAARHLERRRRPALSFLSAKEATRADLSRGSVALIGTPGANPWIRELSDHLELLERSDDLLQVLSPNPVNPRFPMFVVTASSDEMVRKGLMLRRRADVHLRRSDRTVFLGTAGDDWELDGAQSRRFEVASEPTLSTDHFDYLVNGFTEPALSDFAKDNEDLLKSVRELFGGDDPERHVIYLYRSLEEKGLMTEDTRSAHLENGELHVVLGRDRRPSRAVAELLLSSTLPDASAGLASVLVHSSTELDTFDEAARRLLGTTDPPSRRDASTYVSDALDTSFARFLLESEGAKAFTRPVSDVDALEQRWKRQLLVQLPRRIFPSDLPARFHRGFTYAHMGFAIHDGYLSERSDASLDKLAGLGVDAVAIVPYTFLSIPEVAGPLPIPQRPGSETDDDVVHAIRLAQRKGMTVLLKPQIWVRGSWPGAIVAETPDDEVRFFREYGRWLRHYALMAQQERVPLLAIGTELAGMTTSDRNPRWETLIADLRRLYDGKLVYAANWGREVEQIGFWDRLDYIGVDFYYPLSLEDRPSDQELLEGFEGALDQIHEIAGRYEKPVLLTEIGYGSTSSPWKEPHVSDRGPSLSPEDQARAYRVALSALEDETAWVRGMYWWKWPTNLGIGGASDPSFIPNGKPAEDVIREWYGGRLQ